ncbi:MAG TPA: YihY/virulence factor BrkB family protein [bacterium]|nr:YihY/virulence factor BrkB family protein [bacterium]
MKGDNQESRKKPLYASSLAFKTILALVPALAILLAVLSNEAFKSQRNLLLDQLVDGIYPVDVSDPNSLLDPSESQNLKQLNEIGKQQIRFSVRKFAFHSQRAGWFGFLGFLMVVFLLLRDVEHSFNHLWRIERPRPLGSQWLRHMTFFVGLPLALTLLMDLKRWMEGLRILGPDLNLWVFSTFVPFLMTWAAIGWLYQWIPNTRVGFGAAAGAALASTFFIGVARWGMNWYTHVVFKQSNIYGALWIFPVILLWFYVSWLVILFGVEVSFHIQKRHQEMAAR